MPSTLSSSAQLTGSAALTTGFGQLQPVIQKQLSFTYGTGNNQVDSVYFADLLIASSGSPTVLDLTGGGLVMPDGTAFNVLHVKEVFFINNHATVTVAVGGGTAPFVNWMAGTGPTMDLPPGGCIYHVNPLTGWAVTATTADKITLTIASGTNISVTAKITGTTI